MRKIIISVFLFGALLFAPVHISLDYYSNNYVKYDAINSNAYVWIYTPTEFDYYLYGASYIEKANGEAVFIFNCTRNDFVKLNISSAFLRHNNEAIKLDNLMGNFSLKEVNSGKCTTKLTFLIPKNVYEIANDFRIEITGTILTEDSSMHELIYRQKLLRNNNSFTIPFIQHIYNQLTLT